MRLDGQFSYCETGYGVRAYVIDTGIKNTHTEFGSRVDTAPSLVTRLQNEGIYNSLGTQCWARSTPNYSATAAHGTAVASLIGGATFGIAKEATLVDTRVFTCGGGAYASWVLVAVDWIPTDPNRGTAPRVVNMSFAWLSSSDSNSAALKTAINNLVDTFNISVVASAGNDNSNIYWYTPASASRAITVGGHNKDNDLRWQYSNFGSTLELYGPAQYIESAHTEPGKVRSAAANCWNPSNYPQDSCTSGTSFSAPLTTGAIAKRLQANPSSTRDQLLSYLETESANNSGVTVTDPAGNKAIPILNVTDRLCD